MSSQKLPRRCVIANALIKVETVCRERQAETARESDLQSASEARRASFDNLSQLLSCFH